MIIINGINSTMHRRFNIDKPSTAKNSFMYTLQIKDYETYKKNKDIILKLFSKSIEMSIDHKFDRLEINNRKKVFFAKNIKIENDIEKYAEYAAKYLDPEYKYKVED